MNKLKTKIYYIGMIGFLVTAYGLGFGNLSTSAEQPKPKPAAEAEESDQKDISCAEAILDYMNQRENEFLEYLKIHFQNEAPASKLVPEAIKSYDDFTMDLYNMAYDTYNPKTKSEVKEKSSALITKQIDDLSQCLLLVDKRIELIDEVFYQHILSTAHAKKSIKLLDKYQAINAKLEKMVLDSAELQGYFDLFNSKAVCLVQNCKQK